MRRNANGLNDLRNSPSHQNGDNNIRPREPDGFLAAKVIHSNIQSVGIITVIWRAYWKNVFIGSYQCEKTELRPSFLFKTFVQPCTGFNTSKKAANLSSAFWISYALSDQNLPIIKKRVHRRILAQKIQLHDWNVNFPDMALGPTANIRLNENVLKPVRSSELVRQRKKS